MLKTVILDGYVDEPTCLGVPPYISPYPRYIAGSIWDSDKNSQIQYITIDQLRNNPSITNVLSKTNLLIIIAGMSVPGRYLSGYPLGPNETINILQNITKPLKILCGPAAKHGFGISGGKKTRTIDNTSDVFDLTIKGDSEIIIKDLLEQRLKTDKIDPNQVRENAKQIKNLAIKGSKIITQHPNHPQHLIGEIETYRGCPRSIIGGCSFCSEPSKGPPDFRPIKDIIDEIQNLYQNGMRHFRLGNQPCIFSYMSKQADKKEFPQPNPLALQKLFSNIRKVAPSLKTLHIDNANPGILARYPNECTKIAKTIIRYHTPGDVAALGVESTDPIVIKKNNLKASPEQIMNAIQLLNKVGRKRGNNGMPELLPGLNFVFGLNGETKTTYNLNYEFLKNVLDKGLLIRRINLRQIIPIPGTKMYQTGNKIIKKHKHLFQQFKRKIKTNIEQPMLKKILPTRTILKDVYTEKHDGKLTFGRQIGSYPLLIGIPGVHTLNKFYDVKITDYGYRSVTALPYPIDINHASRETIEALPDIGKKRAIRILAKRPFQNHKDFLSCLDDRQVGKTVLDWIYFK